ncbi:MAG: hypothetical protein ACREQO_12700 [Candidatus Binatia bacterium]
MKAQICKGIALASLVTIISSPLYAQTAAPNAPAAPAADQPVTEELGYGIGSALASVFYIPAKVTYAGLGLITGGLGFVLTGGRADVANNIIYPAVRGNYVVTPSHLKGTEPIYFVGASPDAPQPETIASAPSTAPKP